MNKKLIEKALTDKKFLSELLDNLDEKCAKRWPSFEVLNYISEKYPEALCPKWGTIESLFKNGNTCTKYATIHLIANLTKVDDQNKFNKFFDNYFGEIDTDRTVTAAHVTLNAGKIARAKPKLQGRITEKLLSIDRDHKGKQKELIKSYAIQAFSEFFEDIKKKDEVTKFVKDQLSSKSPRTRKKARQFLSKYDIEI